MQDNVHELMLAEKAITEKDYLQAIVYYESYLKTHLLTVEVAHNLSLLYIKISAHEKAKSLLLQAIKLFPETDSLYRQLGNFWKMLGELTKAETCYNKALAINNQEASTYNNLGLLFLQKNTLLEAERNFKQALTLKGDYFTAMYNLALCYKAQKDNRQTVACLLSIISANPNYGQAYFLLGQILLEEKNSQEALQYFHRVASLYPDDVDILHNITISLLEKGYYKEAKPYCLTVADLQPNNTIAIFNLGVIAEKMGSYAEAMNFYEHVLTINPNYFPALNNLAIINLETQNFDKAKKLFEQALQIEPNNKSIIHTLSAIKGDQSIDCPPPEYIKTLFDQYADHFEEHLVKGLDYQVPLLFKQMLERNKLLLEKHYLLLDLGCGTGLVGAVLQDFAANLVGVDLSLRMLEQAKQKNLYSQLINDEIVHYLSTTIKQFNLIVAADVLVYFGNLEQLFFALKKCLMPKGYFMFSIENYHKGEFLLQKSGLCQ